jgi:DnaJ like chaperone protein
MWGKVLGALLGAGAGMLLAWSPGLAAALALAGAALGHFFIDREPGIPRSEQPPRAEELLSRPASPPRAAPRRPRASPRPEDQSLVDLLCPLFVEVARADGPVTQVEVRIVREFFEHTLGFDEAAMEAVRGGLKAAIAAPEGDVEALATLARSQIKPSLRVEVVRALYDIGLTDGDLQRSEQDALKRIVACFHLSEEQLQKITAEFFAGATEHYATLGLDPSAEDDAIKRAYRRLAAEHHPDRAKDGGERFRAVKEAYEALKKLRGL